MGWLVGGIVIFLGIKTQKFTTKTLENLLNNIKKGLKFLMFKIINEK